MITVWLNTVKLQLAGSCGQAAHRAHSSALPWPVRDQAFKRIDMVCWAQTWRRAQVDVTVLAERFYGMAGALARHSLVRCRSTCVRRRVALRRGPHELPRARAPHTHLPAACVPCTCSARRAPGQQRGPAPASAARQTSTSRPWCLYVRRARSADALASIATGGQESSSRGEVQGLCASHCKVRRRSSSGRSRDASLRNSGAPGSRNILATLATEAKLASKRGPRSPKLHCLDIGICPETPED